MPSALAVHSAAAQPFNRIEVMLRRTLIRRLGIAIALTGSDAAPVDAVWLKDGRCVGVSEHKVRQHSRQQMRDWGDTYLITAEKLTGGLHISALLGVPFYVAVVLIPDATAYVWQLSNAQGAPSFAWQTAQTVTQATCEGGTASRMNAYLPFSYAHDFPMPDL